MDGNLGIWICKIYTGQVLEKMECGMDLPFRLQKFMQNNDMKSDKDRDIL